MAVTTSVFPNLNTFTHGPEFCVLFRKLRSTCKTHKRATLTERYPDLCEAIENNHENICSDKPLKAADEDYVSGIDDVFFNHGVVNFNDKLFKLIYR